MNPADVLLVDEYLARRLTDTYLDNFEIQLLEDPSLQKFVTEQIALREWLRSETALLLSAPPVGLLDQIHRFLVTPAWAYAASIALVLLLPIALLPNTGPPAPLAA